MYMRFPPEAHLHPRLTTCDALALTQRSMLPTLSSALSEYRFTCQIRARPSIVAMLEPCWASLGKKPRTPYLAARAHPHRPLHLIYFIPCQA